MKDILPDDDAELLITEVTQSANSVTAGSPYFRQANVNVLPPRKKSKLWNSLNYGKWTDDEEAEALALIRDFERGTLTDCEEGSTLRIYLAKKLHCDPMRISKKLAGRYNGKVQLEYQHELCLLMLACFCEKVWVHK